MSIITKALPLFLGGFGFYLIVINGSVALAVGIMLVLIGDILAVKNNNE